MAGGTITRVALGASTTIVEGNFEGFYENLTMNAGKENRFTAKMTNHGNPKEPVAGEYFKKGWWTDENDKPITEALIGDTVRFNIQMDKTKVPAGSKIDFTLMDWDGMLNPDDPIKLYSTTEDPVTKKYPEITQMTTDANGKASLSINLTSGLVQFTEDDGGNEIELYFDCTYYDISDKETEKKELPTEEFNYLIVYEKEVLITIIVELPHSYYSLGEAAKNLDYGEAISAIGLAGHSAMAIGERYFDYGPDYSQTIVSEKKYDYDFNEDGDTDDNVDLTEVDKNGEPIYSISERFAPGRPWWGEMVADRLGINASDVKLNQVLGFIKLYWDDIIDPSTGRVLNSGTNIYGEVHTIEFYAKESEANKMITWWEERYKHLKVYSVWPWTGEQCTTAVKTAIQEGYPLVYGKVINRLPDITQRPEGLLSDLKTFVSSSKQHFNQPSVDTIIKPEATDYPKNP